MNNFLMKTIFAIGLTVGGLFYAGQSVAQSENELKDIQRAIKRMSKQFEKQAKEIEGDLDSVLDENMDELEDWTEKYEAQWSRWAEGLEDRINGWAEEQEQVWDRWFTDFSRKFESWADELDEEDLNAEELGDLIRKQMKMFGKMPIGELVESIVKEGTEGMEAAPWESLHELQSAFKDSIERAARETEKRMAELKKTRQSAQSDSNRSSGQRAPIEFILPVDDLDVEDGQQTPGNKRGNFKANSKKANSKKVNDGKAGLSRRIKVLHEKMKAGDFDSGDQRKLLELLDQMTDSKTRDGGTNLTDSKKQSAGENEAKNRLRRARKAAERRLKAGRAGDTEGNRLREGAVDETEEVLKDLRLQMKKLEQQSEKLRQKIEALDKG